MFLDIPASAYFEKSVRLDDGSKINWDDYHYRDLMDIVAPRQMVLRTGRQVGKSIFNGLFTLKYAHVPMFRTIYMCPSQKQAEEFSKLKLGKILTFNPELRSLLTNKTSMLAEVRDMKSTSILNDVYVKSFVTGSTLKIGYAADEAGVEKIRGGSADMLIKDESQSMIHASVDPILDPMMSSSNYKIKIDTGTPLDPDDDLCKLFEETTQHTMVVKCHHCGKYTTLNHIKQISRKGVLCFHCMKPVDVRTGKMIPMNPRSKILGFHFNQLMMPGVVYNPFRYQEVVDAVYAKNRDDNKIYHERLGIPKGNISSMLQLSEVEACADSRIKYSVDDFDRVIRNYKKLHGHHTVFGIDWGGGANDQSGGDTDGKSHTAVALMDFYMDGSRLKIKVLYHRIYPLPKVRFSIDDVIRMVKLLPPNTLIGPDAMGGAYANSTIFDIIKSKGGGLKCLPVRFAMMNDLISVKPEQFRVDVDRNFVISKFLKKKVIDRCLEISGVQHNFDEVCDSLMSMKNVTPKKDPGKVMWLLKKNKSNDIAMAMIAGWVSFCADRSFLSDIVL
jgi:hypothetical protein